MRLHLHLVSQHLKKKHSISEYFLLYKFKTPLNLLFTTKFLEQRILIFPNFFVVPVPSNQFLYNHNFLIFKISQNCPFLCAVLNNENKDKTKQQT